MNEHYPNRLGWKRRVGGFLVARLSLLFVAAGFVPHQAAGQAATPFRIGFSSTCFDEVNENDAKAAVKVWAQVLAKERGIPADPQPYILKGVDEIAAALIEKRIDAISLTTEQYFTLKKRVALDQCVVSVTANSIYDEYVLLVHRDSGIDRLGQLRGRTWLSLEARARPWRRRGWQHCSSKRDSVMPPTSAAG